MNHNNKKKIKIETIPFFSLFENATNKKELCDEKKKNADEGKRKKWRKLGHTNHFSVRN